MNLSSISFHYDGENFKEIYNARKLSQIVLDTISYHEQRAKEATERANKTREEVAQEIKNEWEAENRNLKERLRFSVASLSSEKELADYTAFVEAHEACRLKSKMDGAKMPYVKQFGTGVGCCTYVYCQVCGQRKDITDSSVW